jgi:2,3-bisphosphoglycerate-independent phosphoglycerate mutase
VMMLEPGGRSFTEGKQGERFSSRFRPHACCLSTGPLQRGLCLYIGTERIYRVQHCDHVCYNKLDDIEHAAKSHFMVAANSQEEQCACGCRARDSMQGPHLCSCLA